MQPKTLFRYYGTIGSIGAISTITGLFSLILSPIFLEYLLESAIVLSPDSRIYNLWRVTPIPLTLNCYLFNWTNPEQLRNSSTKPHLQEIGPYSFRETIEKVNITWHDNGTVSFRQLRKWYFDRENSYGDLEDEITSLNGVAVGAVYRTKSFSYALRKVLSLTLSTMHSDIHVTKKVAELLFDGYEHTVVNIARTLPEILQMLGIEIPPMDTFGWLIMRNDSTFFDGLLTMGTGQKDIPLGVVDRWNNQRSTKYYEGQCANLGGFAGELWPQNIKPYEAISVFVPDFCRELFFEFEKEVMIQGIRGYRYIGGNRTMDNGTLYPEYRCYCNGKCIPSGAVNISSCKYGFPGFISFPHFYEADHYYLNKFEGISPDKNKHELSITLEPRTGILLDVAARLQGNILMEPSDSVTLLRNVPKLFFPIMWIEQKATLSDDLAFLLKLILNLPTIVKIISAIILASGIFILLVLAISTILKRTHYFTHKEEIKRKYLTKEEIPLKDSAT